MISSAFTQSSTIEGWLPQGWPLHQYHFRHSSPDVRLPQSRILPDLGRFTEARRTSYFRPTQLVGLERRPDERQGVPRHDISLRQFSCVWLIFFHPVPSHKTSRFAHLYPEVRVQHGNIHVRSQTKGTIMTSENSQNLVHYLKLYALNMLRPQPSLSAARISTSIPNDLVQEQAEPRVVAGSAPNHRPIVHQNVHTIPRGMGDHWVVNAVIFA